MTRKTIATMALALGLTTTLHAQTFLDHLQDDDKSKGSVSVKQSEDISKLVNGSGNKSKQEQGQAEQRRDQDSKPQQEARPQRSSESSRSSESRSSRESEASRDRASSRSDEARDKERRERERKRREAQRDQKLKELEETATADAPTRKKVMSNSKKVMGYRIQVFAGANTREDRAKAQEMGAKIKVDVPGQPVYVHFYSPRWCCRFGNYRRQDDANDMLKKIKKMGYKNSCVVKSAITVNR